MNPPSSAPDHVAWLFRPWNAAFCLWGLVWGVIAVCGTVDYLRPEHADELWQVGWGWVLLIAGSPLTFAFVGLLEYGAGMQPLTAFLFTWLVCAVESFVFWLVFVPLAYRCLGANRSGRTRELS